jgi:putative inorganic carbon (hco3(-)) transporter
MRDIALTAVFAWLLVLMLKHTWIGAMVWTWFSLMNPHKLTWGFAYSLPFAMITAMATMLSILWSKGKVRLPADLSVVLLVLFLLWTCVTTYFAILQTQSSTVLLTFVKIQLMTLVCIAAIRERKHIEIFVWICFISVGFYGVKGGIFAILTGGGSRVWGPADSYIQSNNTLGVALTMVIPLGYYLYQSNNHKWARRSLLLFVVLSSVGVLATQSRGALLAIAAMAFVLWLRMKKKFVPAIVMIAIGTSMLAFMPESWTSRMNTIKTYEEDGSAMSRISTWETAVNIANDRVTGSGFAFANRDIFLRYSPRPDWVFTAHSIYFQVIGEHGWTGLVLFLSIGAICLWNSIRLRSEGAKRPETQWVRELSSMLQVSMVGYAVGGAFLSLAYWDMPYNLLVIVIAMKYWMREKRWETETTGLFGATSQEERRLLGQAGAGSGDAGVQAPATVGARTAQH